MQEDLDVLAVVVPKNRASVYLFENKKRKVIELKMIMNQINFDRTVMIKAQSLAKLKSNAKS